MSTLSIVLFAIIIYLISVFSCYFLNKKLYKLRDLEPNVFAWICPIINTFCVLILLVILIGNYGILSKDYWEDKW
mgnify:CR=1 FL=1